MLVVIVQVGQGDDAPLSAEPVAEVTGDATFELGRALVDPNRFMLPFEVASVLLAGALIGAIYIARDDEAE